MEKRTSEDQVELGHTPPLLALEKYTRERKLSNASSITLSESHTLPNFIIIYRTSVPSLSIGPWYEEDKFQPPHLFHISINTNHPRTNWGEISLHSGPEEKHSIIGNVRFQASAASDIIIRRNCQNAQFFDIGEAVADELHVELSKKGSFTTSSHSFHFNIPSMEDGPPIREIFEWRRSGDPEIKSLADDNVSTEKYTQDNRGLKLVNVRTRHLIAVFVGGKNNKIYNPRNIAGKLRFISVEDWGEEFRQVVVMSILSLMERG